MSPCLVGTEVMSEIIDKFRHKMMMSGYSFKERELIVREGRNRYQNVLKQVENGLRPLFRSASWEKEARAVKKKVKGRHWFGKRFDSLLFVQSSPGEVLRKEIQKVIDSNGFRVKVVERGGRPVRSLLQKSDVEPQLDCLDDKCPVCMTAPRGLCRMESVGYRIWCVPCKAQGIDVTMDGETGRTAKVRCKEHFDAMRSLRQSSNLREHCELIHDGEEVEFGCKVVSRFPGDPLTRQVEEAVRIDHQEGISMNDKHEFVRPAGVRIRAERM